MTTTTHSHKAWADKGGHVTLKDLLAVIVLHKQVSELTWTPEMCPYQDGMAPLGGALWIVRLNQIKQYILRHHRLNIAEKSLAPSAFLDVGLFVITEYELLAAFHTIP